MSDRPVSEEGATDVDAEEISVGADIDVRAFMAEIKDEVERKRRAGFYPPAVLAELELASQVEAGDDQLKIALQSMRQAAEFSTAVSTQSRIPVLSPVASSFKKAVRGSVGWYLAAILQQVEVFASRTLRTMTLLSERIHELEQRVPGEAREVGPVEAAVAPADRPEDLDDETRARLSERIPLLERSVRGLRERLEDVTMASQPMAGQAAPSREIERSLDYLDFENQFRGTEDMIRHRQQTYVDQFRDVPGPVVDLGCGRGEFLDLLGSAGVGAYGVDRHPEMVDLCREKGFDVREADALDHLSSVPSGTLGGVFSAQMIEHLDLRDVPRFFELAADVLAPSGRLIVETVNPESLFVFAGAFYVDLGHLRPLHSLTLQFLAEKAGFSNMRIEYCSLPPADLRPMPLEASGDASLDRVIEGINQNFRRLDEIVFGPQDYALVADR
jgi:O-antigen chain-terminating methyltransferase